MSKQKSPVRVPTIPFEERWTIKSIQDEALRQKKIKDHKKAVWRSSQT